MKLLHILSLSILMVGSPSLFASNNLLIKLKKMAERIGVLKGKALREKQAYLVVQKKAEIKRIQDDTKRMQDDIKRIQKETAWWRAGCIAFVTIGLIGYKTGIISINK